MNAASTSSVTPLAWADRISTRRRPNVSAPRAGRAARRSAISERPSAAASVSMWPASDSSASECATTPAAIAAHMTFFMVRLGGRPADTGHPYGHSRAENLGALGEASILIAGGIVVVVEAISRLVGGSGLTDVHGYQFAVIGAALVIEASRA